MSVNKKILRVEDLRVYFETKKGISKAVDGNNFTMYENETLAIVGESGCGKSVTAMSILNLVSKPGKIMEGSKIMYMGDSERDEEGINLATATDAQIRDVRGNGISMIFQEPMTSLNPVFTVGKQITENILLHEKVSKEEADNRAKELLKMVGISRPEKVFENYPHQLSGGMCQRVMIAMALSCNPKLLIADEPTTALDVTIQAQILSLMNELKEKTGTSIMLITHDLGVVAQVADYVNVMYAGKVVERAAVDELFENPKHPYTHGLFGSIPSLDEECDRLKPIQGLMPDPTNLPTGCKFHPRCPHATELCSRQQPQITEVTPGHKVRCLICEGLVKEEEEKK